jgi:hypothetical protein
MAGKMALDKVRSGKLINPLRVLLYGVEKVGKSTFAAGAPAPIFICPEDGTAELDVARFPEPATWDEVIEAVETLTTEPHDYQTLVLDTLDWIEPMVLAWVIAHSPPDKSGRKCTSIETANGGYGRGFEAAVDQWRRLLDRLARLRTERRMNIVLLAHSWIKSFKNPAGDDFDRYELVVNRKAAGVLKQWCDAVLFARHDVETRQDGQRAKGISTSARFIHTTHCAAWDAGNRYGLPERMPLSWDEFYSVAREAKPDASAIVAEALRLAAGSAVEAKATAAAERVAGDATKAAQLLDWVRGKLAA